MTRIIGPPKSRRRHWTLLWCLTLAVGVGVFYVAGAQSLPPQTQGYIELDKNATNNLTTFHLGTLLSSIKNANATSFDVCERTPTLPGDILPPTLTTPFTILIDGETMTVTAVGASQPASGACKYLDPADTTADVRTYTVTRGTGATAHPAGSDVTRMVTGAVAGIDWNDVFTAVTTAPPNTTNPCSAITDARACDYLTDPPGQSIFTQGSSDPQDMDQEHWTDSSVPDADELLDAFAIKFQGSAVGAHQFLYFGADRYATNGAKDMGFWFFKKNVQTKPDGTFVDETGAPAKHSVGDILLLGTFTQGGAVTTIRIFKWVGSGGSDGSLNAEGNFGDCVPGSASNDGCDTVSNTTVPSPWAYAGKGAVAPNVIYGGGLMEGGIDLTALNLQGCFASFMAETRSSPSLTAAQKDFTLGKFESCGATLVTTPQDGAGTTVPSGGLDLGTGTTGVTAKDSALLTVTGTTDFTGTVSFFICGPIAESATCDTGGVPAGSTNVTASGTYTSDTVKLTKAANNTTGAPGHYCWRGVFTSTTPGLTAGAKDNSLGECFHVNPVTPTLSTTAVDCTANHTALSGPVDFPGPFCDKAVLGGTANRAATNGSNATYPSILTGNPLPASNGAAAGGTITFTLVGPDTNVTVCSPATVVATGTNPQTATVSGDNSYFTTGVTVSSPGVYHWKASYGGDDPNTLSKSHNDNCDQTPEDVTVRQIPTDIKTKQSWFPNDTATITSTVTGDNLGAGGTVDFTLYDTGTCTGNALYTERQTLTGGSHSEEVATHNYTGSTAQTPGGVTVTPYRDPTGYADAAGSTLGPHSWKVVYTPAAADTAHVGSSSTCTTGHTESHSYTYTNDPGH
jgi:hypothetical protein